MNYAELTQDQLAAAPVAVQRHLPQPFIDELKALEAELDTLAPGWERPRGGHVKVRPFGGMPPSPHKTRLQWVLKRHQHLLRGMDCAIRAELKADGNVTMVSVIGKPHIHGVSYEPPKLVEAMLVGNAAPLTARAARPLDIALETRLPLEVVEAAEAKRPEGEDPFTWARAWYAARRD